MNDKPESRKAVLKIKLGACLVAPTKRMAADLHAAALLFNQARNAMVRHWERWCEDNSAALADGKMTLPQGFTTQLYHAGRKVAPALASIVVASASNTILSSHILKRTPWNHRGKARRMWQAILGNEAARPCFREAGIAAPNKTTTIRCGEDHATLTFGLWSKQAGRANTQMSCRIAIGRMPAGLKKIIRLVATGQNDWRLCDSEIVWHEGRRRGKGDWYFHMCYERPPMPQKLNPTNVASLEIMTGEASHPFQVSMATTFPRQIRWPNIGDVNVLLAKYTQLETRRLVMRNRYQDAGSGRKGHGRKRIEAAIRPVSRQAHALMERFSKNCVGQVIKFCRNYDCGTLVYDEPRMKQKAGSWFAAKQIPFDWTRLRSQLDHRCWLFNIRLVASGDVVDDLPEIARVSQGNGSKEDHVGDGNQAAPAAAKKPSRSRKPL